MQYQEGDFRVFVDPQAKRHGSTAIFVEAPARVSAHGLMRGFIGAYTYVRDGSRLGSGVRSIGRYCSIAPGAVLGDGQHHLDWLTTHPFVDGPEYRADEGKLLSAPHGKDAGRTVIGNDVWIGANAIVMRGIVVGDGAVIGAGAVVTKDVPSYAIVAGVPARILRYRFPRQTVRLLLKLQWWQYTAASLVGVPFHDVEAAIAEIERRRCEGALRTIDHPLLRIGRIGEIWWVRRPENIRKARRIYEASRARTRIMPPKPKPSKGRRLLRAIAELFAFLRRPRSQV